MTTTTSHPSVRGADRIAFLRLRGTLDDNNVLSFKKSVFNIPPEKKALVLDLSRLDRATNAGLASLLDSLKYFRKRKGRVFLVSPGEELELLLLHFRAGELAEIVRSYDEVLNLLSVETEDGSQLFGQPEPDSETGLDAPPHRGTPVIHYHYYGKNVEREEAVIRKAEADPQSGQSAPLQELNRRLHQLQKVIEAKDGSKPSGVIEKRLDDLLGSEARIVDRLQVMERAIEGRLDGMEARLLDRIDSSRPAATALSARPAARSFPGFRMIQCNECGTMLRVRQSGRHMCPGCKTEFIVDDSGEAEF